MRTDLAAIQQEETDQAYAEDWLQAQMLEYERVAGKGSCQLAEICRIAQKGPNKNSEVGQLFG